MAGNQDVMRLSFDVNMVTGNMRYCIGLTRCLTTPMQARQFPDYVTRDHSRTIGGTERNRDRIVVRVVCRDLTRIYHIFIIHHLPVQHKSAKYLCDTHRPY